MAVLLNLKEGLKSTEIVLESLKADCEQSLLSLKPVLQHVTEQDDEDIQKQSTLPGVVIEETFTNKKSSLLASSLSRIHEGLQETELLFTCAKYIERLEAELARLKLRYRRLNVEAEWLRDELRLTQTKLVDSETTVSRCAVEKRHYEFLLEMRQFDDAVAQPVKLDNQCNDGVTTALRMTNDVRPINPRHHFRPVFMGSTTNSMIFESDLDAKPPPAWQHPFTPRKHGPVHKELSQDVQDGNLSLLDSTSDIVSCNDSIQTTEPSSINIPVTKDDLLSPVSSASIGGLRDFYRLDLTNAPKSVGDGTMSAPQVRALHRIVLAYTSQGKHDVAVSICMRAIDQLKKSEATAVGRREDRETELAVLLNMLALIYRDQGKYKMASELLTEVVSIRERTLGPNNLLVAWSLNNLAVLYAKTARFDEAEPLCRRALAIREQLLGPSHPDVARQLNNLALLCQSQRRFCEVEACFRRALDINLKNHKPWSPVVLRAKNNLASALIRQGSLHDAELLLKAILTPDCVPSSPWSLSSACKPEDQVFDSAVFLSSSTSTTMNSNCNVANATAAQELLPLWLIAEQHQLEATNSDTHNHSVPRITKGLTKSPGNGSPLDPVDLVAWSADARIEASIVMSAVRNLAIVYQRLGHHAQSDLLRSWLHHSVSGSGLQASTGPSPARNRSTPTAMCASSSQLFSSLSSSSIQPQGFLSHVSKAN